MQRLLAKALYDNVAESPDELEFKRGEVIMVLEQETGGLEGWWLCSLRGKQGIAPGNRLKMMTGLVAKHIRSQTMEIPTANQKEAAEWNRRSWDGSSNNSSKVVMPSRQGDLYTYNQSGGAGQSDYDVPPSRYPGMNSTIGNNSNHSSREDLLNASATSSFDQSFYDTPPQSRSFRSPELSMYDTPPSHLGLDVYDSPSGSVRTSLLSKYSDETMSMSSGMSYNTGSKSNPPSMCDSARSSMDISPMDMYDVPPSQREREARDAKAALYPIRSSKDSGLDMYDSPPKVKNLPGLDDYDVPKVSSEKHFKNVQIPHSETSSPGDTLEDYDVPPTRSPFAQSIASNAHNTSLQSDTSELEDYDVPRVPQPVVGKPPIAGKSKRQKSNSLGSLLDDYDTPQSRGLVTKDDMFTKSQSKKSYNPETSDDEANYDEPDQVNNESSPEPETRPKLLKQEHAVDDLYDTPRNNAPVKNMNKEFSALSISHKAEPCGVYDIPPQVTRDSIISSRSDSSDGTDNCSSRLSTCSTDSRGSDIPIYDELPLDLDAANDLVIKLQQDVQKAVNDFSKYIHSSWRKRDNYEQKQYEIKQACNKVENALGEFVEFGQGTLANSAKLSDRKLINKLSKYLIPLQQALQQLRVCIKHLDDVNWQASKGTLNESSKKDDLGIIASLTKDLISDIRKLAAFIQGNSSLLFKRAKDFHRSSRSMEHQTPPSASKTMTGRKPAIPAKTTPVQARPLPAPPPMERPLPPTPTDKKPKPFAFSPAEISKRLSGDFGNKRSSGEYKNWPGDIQVKRLSNENSSFNATDLLQEYDYVELEEDERVNKLNGETKENSVPKESSKVKDIAGSSSSTSTKEEIAANDSYSKEMEQTLDEIDGVNIYSEDSDGTLKRGMELPSSEGECGGESGEAGDTGTLKRKSPEIEATTKDVTDEYSGNGSGGSDTLTRDSKLTNEMSDEELTPVSKEQQRIEVPEHDIEPAKVAPLEFEDKQVLTFYSEQLETHTTLLTNSIDAFFQCIESNEAPKVFISHSKFVVVSAHKLVYIGDSLHKNLKHEVLRGFIIQRANYLCDCLKRTVTSTKTAALQYPSVPAVQDMVDRVVEVSHAARDLKMLVTEVTKP